MARRYRLEYLRKKRAKEREKELRRQQIMESGGMLEFLRQKWSSNFAAKDKSKEYTVNESEELAVNETEEFVINEKEPSLLKEFLGWVLYIAIIISATYLIVTFVGQRTRVSGDSMESALHNGDNLIVDKISYRFREPERYEIIVFPYKYQENTFYIKRIIGLPGETVQVKDGEVYINGKLLGESYGLEQIEEGREGIAIVPITLGPDEYFVLGDNRNHSSDSRDPSVGILTKDDLIGRAWVRIWPLDSIGVIPHE